MLPQRKEALAMLEEASALNPGPWFHHSLVAADCAEKIAARCPGLDAEKAYILGLLHDIRRRYGFSYLRHVIDGYDYLMALGYEEAAKICLSHSFDIKDLSSYVGKQDVTQEQKDRILQFLQTAVYDDYDRLIQVCDSIAMPHGPVDMETRMMDVKKRYGSYPQDKWKKHLELKRYFEEKAGMELDSMVSCAVSSQENRQG